MRLGGGSPSRRRDPGSRGRGHASVVDRIDAILDRAERKLAGQHPRGSGVYLSRAFDERGRPCPSNEGSADIPITHQPLDRGDRPAEKAIASAAALAVVGRHRDHDRIRRPEERPPATRQAPYAQCRPTEIDGSVIEGTGNVREINPFEEAMGLVRRWGEPLDTHAFGAGNGQGPRLQRSDVPEPEVGQRNALSLAAPKSGPCSAMAQRGRKPSGSRTTTSSPRPVIRTML